MIKITLKQARVGKGLTQEQAADAVGVHQNTISNWEDKPSSVPISKAYALAKLYAVSLDDLIFEP